MCVFAVLLLLLKILVLGPYVCAVCVWAVSTQYYSLSSAGFRIPTRIKFIYNKTHEHTQAYANTHTFHIKFERMPFSSCLLLAHFI